jgi:hypothetical protein
MAIALFHKAQINPACITLGIKSAKVVLELDALPPGINLTKANFLNCIYRLLFELSFNALHYNLQCNWMSFISMKVHDNYNLNIVELIEISHGKSYNAMQWVFFQWRHKALTTFAF